MKKLLSSTKFWICLIAAVFVLSLAAIFVLGRFGHSAATANIYLNGECIRSIDLSQVDSPYSFTVEGSVCTNTIEVENGRIRVSSATCPDKICVQSGWLSQGITPIVCLPNQLTIQLQASSDAGEIDAIAN